MGFFKNPFKDIMATAGNLVSGASNIVGTVTNGPLAPIAGTLIGGPIGGSLAGMLGGGGKAVGTNTSISPNSGFTVTTQPTSTTASDGDIFGIPAKYILIGGLAWFLLKKRR